MGEMTQAESDARLDELPDNPMFKLYDRTGKQITLRQHAELFGKDEYRFLRRDSANGFGITTVWLGDVHEDVFRDPMPNPPRIFGTLIWKQRKNDGTPEKLGLNSIAEFRHGTESLAIERHDRLLAAMKESREKLDEVIKSLEEDAV